MFDLNDLVSDCDVKRIVIGGTDGRTLGQFLCESGKKNSMKKMEKNNFPVF